VEQQPADIEQGFTQSAAENHHQLQQSSSSYCPPLSQLEFDPGENQPRRRLAHTLRLLWHETRTILALCWAPIVTYTLHALMSVVSVYFVGQLGSTKLLAGAALATSFINITGISVAYGMASAIDTLASQMVGSFDRAGAAEYSQIEGQAADHIDSNDDEDGSGVGSSEDTTNTCSDYVVFNGEGDGCVDDDEEDINSQDDNVEASQIVKSAMIILSPNAETSASPNAETTAGDGGSALNTRLLMPISNSYSTSQVRIGRIQHKSSPSSKQHQPAVTPRRLSGNPRHQLGVLLQKSLAILLLCSVPIAIIWLNTDSLLEHLAGQDPEIARLAGRYCKLFLPGFPLFMIYEAMKRFLQAQGLVRAPMYGMLVANIVNWLGHWLTVRPPSDDGIWWVLGYDGAPISEAVAYATLPLSAYFYMRFSDCLRPVWGGWTWDALRGWSVYMRLAVPGTIMLCCEWWAFEICALVAGLIGPNALAAHSVVQTAVYSLYMIPNGLSVATTVRVGNLLGAGRGSSARIAAAASLLVTFLGMLVNVVLIVAYRRDIGVWFSGGDSSVTALVTLILPVNAAYQVFDGLQTSAQGILRGCGRAKAGAVFTLVSYYAVGLPVAMALAFSPLSSILRSVYGGSVPLEITGELGAVGLWWGIAAAIFVLTTGMMVFLARLDWRKEVERDQLNVNSAITAAH
jgi:MATE family multidrug resistance protein